MSVTIKIRSRLSSVGDSAPPSESSDGSTSETFEHGPGDWHPTDNHHHHQTQIMTNDSIYSGSSGDAHMLSPDLGGAINDNERVQVESFFSGLGTEVSVRSGTNETPPKKKTKQNKTHCLSINSSLSLCWSREEEKSHTRAPSTQMMYARSVFVYMRETSSRKKVLCTGNNMIYCLKCTNRSACARVGGEVEKWRAEREQITCYHRILKAYSFLIIFVCV